MRYIKLYKAVKAEFQASPKSKNPWDGGNGIIGVYFYRPLGLVLAPMFILLGVSANIVTLIAVLFGTISNVLFLSGLHEFFFTASICYIIFALLDFTDGVVARNLKSSTFYGKIVDSVGGILVSSFTPFCVGFGLWQLQLIPNEFPDHCYILIAALASISNLVTKLLNETYTACKYQVYLIRGDSLPQSTNNTVFEKPKFSMKRLIFHLTSGTTQLLLLALYLIDLTYFYPILILIMSTLLLIKKLYQIHKEGPEELRHSKA